jgi:hypothetical protein
LNAAGTNTTAISVPEATGGVYSAFAVGTASAGSLEVILVRDSAGTTEPLPSTGGISPMWLAAGLATMGVMVYASVRGGAYAVRRIRAND